MEPHHLNSSKVLHQVLIHLRSLTVLQHHHRLLQFNTRWFQPKVHHHLNIKLLRQLLLLEATTFSPRWDLMHHPMANNLRQMLPLPMTMLLLPLPSMETCPLVENFTMQEFLLQPSESCSSSHKNSRIPSF